MPMQLFWIRKPLKPKASNAGPSTKSTKNGSNPPSKSELKATPAAPPDPPPRPMHDPPSIPPRTSSIPHSIQTCSSTKPQGPDYQPEDEAKKTTPTTHEAPPNILTLHLLIGTQNPSSHYLTARLFQVPPHHLQNAKLLSKYQRYAVPASENARIPIIHFPDLDPHAFHLYTEYNTMGLQTYAQTLPDKKCTWRICWPLVNAHILGIAIQDAAFANLIMDILGEKLVLDEYADVNTIRHVFTVVGVSQQLKRFLVDRCLAMGRNGIRGRDLQGLPKEFLDMMTKGALRLYRSEDAEEKKGRSRYHVYAEEEACYEKKYATRGMRKEMERAAMSKESKESMETARENGVKCVDWADRRSTQSLWDIYRGDTVAEAPKTGGGLEKIEGTRVIDSKRTETGERKSPNEGARGDVEPYTVNGDALTTMESVTKGTKNKDRSPSQEDKDTWELSQSEQELILDKTFESRIRCPGAYPDSIVGS